MTSRRDSGQIGILVVALAAVVLVVVQGVADFADALIDSARAQSAADAVALAVAADRPDVADRLAVTVGATVLTIDRGVDTVVRTSVDGRTALARAATTP